MTFVPAPPAPMAIPARESRLSGVLFSPWRLEQNIIELLQLGLPAYLDEAAKQDGGDPSRPAPRVERPKSWERHDDIDGLPDDQLPRVIVINQGTLGRPTRDASGTYSATWLVTIAAVVYDTAHHVAKRTAGAYAAAIWGVMLQHGTLCDPLIRDVTWGGGTNPSLSAPGLDRQGRLIAATRQDFEIQIAHVVGDYDGPLNLDNPPLPPTDTDPVDMGDQPIVTHVELDVQPVTDWYDDEVDPTVTSSVGPTSDRPGAGGTS